jgi:hypothetical protein
LPIYNPGHPDQGLPGSGARPDQGLPGQGGGPTDPGFGVGAPGKLWVVAWLAGHGWVWTPIQPPKPDQGLPPTGQPPQPAHPIAGQPPQPTHPIAQPTPPAPTPHSGGGIHPNP